MRSRCQWMMRALTPALTDFRQRELPHEAQDRLLEPILQVCREHGWLNAGGKQRTDSTWVIAKMRGLSSLESVGESLRASLNELAEAAPDWLLGVITPDWFDRYVHRFELQRFPKGEQARESLRRQVGESILGQRMVNTYWHSDVAAHSACLDK